MHAYHPEIVNKWRIGDHRYLIIAKAVVMKLPAAITKSEKMLKIEEKKK
ncbi:MAG: hypothetical protein L6Q53_03575 [Candidatus Brocadia sinica]|uniref:Uncharacterized protein n=1 Tax=Candidatus Brocadia sinica JPN1 TaxID=1197129 RepID=A0ABQ0JZ30_9BACT|nr:hypothetical protein [Candidatus Brocadia sinica]MCK6467262.1 hypothetical protein [Candidatus Brocadia sinica]NOG40144.1 hypothetical protein [Planctomycetota bacterium]GAN34028.1 hypothetical protein BROSI_A2563 [Candidatus Brocadia sinica JPN1]